MLDTTHPFLYLKATCHLSVRLTAMHVTTVNEVSSHLCKILTLIIVKTYLQTERRRYRIARRPVVKADDSHVPVYRYEYNVRLMVLSS